MNSSRQDVLGAMSKIPQLTLDSEGESNIDTWEELMVPAITTIFGSHVAAAITEGTVPKFKSSFAPRGSNKETKKKIDAKNEEIHKQEIKFYENCDKAVAIIMTTMSRDSTTRLKRHADFEQVKNKDGLYNIIQFMALVRSTHQLQDNQAVRQSKKNELHAMKQGDEEKIMVFLERVYSVAKVAYPDGHFNQAKFLPTFIANCNDAFKALPTEEEFVKIVGKFLDEIHNESMPEKDRTLFKFISVVENTAMKHNKLSANIHLRSSPAKTESSSMAMVAAQVKIGKSPNKNGDDNNLHCRFCEGLPEDKFRNVNPDNHPEERCFRKKKAIELLSKMQYAGNNGDTRDNRSSLASNANEVEREGNSQNRKRFRKGKNNNNPIKRQAVEASQKNVAQNIAQQVPNKSGRVFTTLSDYAQDDVETGTAWITTEDYNALSIQSTLRGINNPSMKSLVVDNACDRNLIKDIELFIGELQDCFPVRMNGIGNGSVVATQKGPTIFGMGLYTPTIGFNLLSHPQMIREGAIDSTRIKYNAPRVQGALDSFVYPDIYGEMREFAPIPGIPTASKLYQHVFRPGKSN